jgi:glycosyltransferase involved in cell wall biosynthesis
MKRKIKVLHIINGEFYAGAERVQDHLALRLPEFGVEVGFICLKPRDFPRQRLARDTPLVSLPMHSRFDIGVIRGVARHARERGYNLIHTHTSRSALVGCIAARLTGLPMCHHVHSPTTEDTENPWRNRLNAIVERLSLSKVKQLIAVSDAMREHLLGRGFPSSLITVIYNGVPTSNDFRIRKRPEDEWILGTVAYFRPRKGLDVLIRSLYQMRQSGLAVRLRVIGGFETTAYEQEIHKSVQNLTLQSHIDWIGFSNNVMAELEKMDIFVLPSLFGEGLPMVVLEAMSAGLPVVASRVEGIPEAVGDGQEGLLVEPGDSDALALSLQGIIEGRYDWSSMCSKAYDRQRNHFSDVSMAQGVADLYWKLLGA